MDIAYLFNRLHDWLCRLLCGKRLFNSDMSREIDHLIIENGRLREIIDKGNQEPETWM